MAFFFFHMPSSHIFLFSLSLGSLNVPFLVTPPSLYLFLSPLTQISFFPPSSPFLLSLPPPQDSFVSISNFSSQSRWPASQKADPDPVTAGVPQSAPLCQFAALHLWVQRGALCAERFRSTWHWNARPVSGRSPLPCHGGGGQGLSSPTGRSFRGFRSLKDFQHWGCSVFYCEGDQTEGSRAAAVGRIVENWADIPVVWCGRFLLTELGASTVCAFCEPCKIFPTHSCFSQFSQCSFCPLNLVWLAHLKCILSFSVWCCGVPAKWCGRLGGGACLLLERPLQPWISSNSAPDHLLNGSNLITGWVSRTFASGFCWEGDEQTFLRQLCHWFPEILFPSYSLCLWMELKSAFSPAEKHVKLQMMGEVWTCNFWKEMLQK